MSSNERQELQRARELIINKQFAEARAILHTLSDSALAQQWLAKLDEIAPPQAAPAVERDSPIRPLDTSATPPPADPVAPGPVGARPSKVLLKVDINDNTLSLNERMARYLSGGLAGLGALIMIVGFYAFPWVDLARMGFFGMNIGAFAEGFGGEIDTAPLEITALELFTGRNNGEDFTMDLTNPTGGGMSAVRFVDRLVIFIPIGALVLAFFAWNYVAEPSMLMAAALAVMALLLLLMPFIWESMSENALEDDLAASMNMDGSDLGQFGAMMIDFKSTYSTGEQKTLGVLALLAGLCAVGIEFAMARERQR